MRERIRATIETIIDEEPEAALGATQSRQSCSTLRTQSAIASPAEIPTSASSRQRSARPCVSRATPRQPLLNSFTLSNDLLTVYKVVREFESLPLQHGVLDVRDSPANCAKFVWCCQSRGLRILTT